MSYKVEGGNEKTASEQKAVSYKLEAGSEQKAISCKPSAISGVAGKYQPYPEYKESGVDWLGEIPVNWGISRIKYLATLNSSKSEVRHLSADSMVSFIPMEAIGENGELDNARIKPLGEVLSGYTYVANGDVMLAKITPCFENGKAAIASGLKNGIGFATTEVIPVRPKRKLDARFFYYLLHSDPFKSLAEGAMYGAGGQKRVADGFVAEYHFALPDAEERDTIAAFLDYETARIDALIAKQQWLIELLKEKRQAVISHAVTKGLNPNVPMKDSGVEWLGQVPAHWEVCRLKHHIISMEQGWSPQCEARLAEEGEYGVLKVGCVNGGVFRPQEHKALPGTISPKKEYSLKKGQLLISRANTRELVGSAAVVDQDYSNLLLCDKLYRLKFSEEVQPEFISYLLGSPLYRSQIELSASGASDSMQNIGQSSIRELPVALPPLKEVVDILSHMSSSLIKFNMLHEQLETQALLLSERRTALISAAVTGKIDVRGWQPPAEAEHAYS